MVTTRARLLKATALIATLAFAGTAMPALAQDNGGAAAAADDTSPGDIIVTAQKRSQALSDVPISITAFSKEELERNNIRNLDDIIRNVPNITLSRGYTNVTWIGIRGIYSESGAPTVGVYIDETPIQVYQRGFVGNANPKIFDLDRLEVLRGPQGTLYGASSMGGTLRYITTQPSLTTFSGKAAIEGALVDHGAPSFEAAAAVGGPIINDQLGFRASVYFRRDGGFIDKIDNTGRVIDRDINNEKSFAAKGALKTKIGSDFDATLSLYFQRLNRDDLPLYDRPGQGYPQQFTQFQQNYKIAQPGREDFFLPTLTVNGNLGKVTLTSITSFFRRDDRQIADYSDLVTEITLVRTLGAPFIGLQSATGATNLAINRQRNFAQEVRLASADPDARFNWVIGGFYQNAKLSFFQSIIDPGIDNLFLNSVGVPTSAVFGVPLLANGAYYEGNERFGERQLAGFGEINYKLTPQIELVAGARVSRTKVTVQVSADGPVNGGPTPPALAAARSQSETPVSPKFGINFRPGDDQLIYTVAAKGFRTGSSNLPVPTAPCAAELASIGLTSAPQGYNSDTLWNYELGYRGSIANKRLSIAATAFQVDWSNIQQSVFLAGCGFGFTANLGQARSRGFELEINAHPVKPLYLSGAVGFTDAKFTKTIALSGNNIVVSDGDSLPQVPRWTATAGAELRFPVADLPAYLRADVQYRGGVVQTNNAADVAANPLLFRIKDYTYTTARAGVTKDDWEAALYVDNLFDISPAIGRNGGLTPFSGSRIREFTVRPRTIGVRVSRTF